MTDDEDDDLPDVPGVDRGGYWAEVTLVANVAARVCASRASNPEEAVALAARIVSAAEDHVTKTIDEAIASARAAHRRDGEEPS